MHADSVAKVVERYFATVTKVPFTFNGKTYQPKPLHVSPTLLQGYTCPPNCGGCCGFKFTLDYLPSEEKPAGVTARTIDFNGRQVEMWTDAQKDSTSTACRHLKKEDGRCSIYTVRPFSCDFELIRPRLSEDHKWLGQMEFGRGSQYKRVDGGKGALCEMLPPDPHSVSEVIRKLKRLKEWT